jgi:hypothetical protein
MKLVLDIGWSDVGMGLAFQMMIWFGGVRGSGALPSAMPVDSTIRLVLHWVVHISKEAGDDTHCECSALMAVHLQVQ